VSEAAAHSPIRAIRATRRPPASASEAQRLGSFARPRRASRTCKTRLLLHARGRCATRQTPRPGPARLPQNRGILQLLVGTPTTPAKPQNPLPGRFASSTLGVIEEGLQA
jgi:hypothetical protein